VAGLTRTRLAAVILCSLAVAGFSFAEMASSDKSSPTTSGSPKLDDWQLAAGAWPTSCDAAARDILSWISPDARDELRATPREDLIKLHFGLGLTIRNRQDLCR